MNIDTCQVCPERRRPCSGACPCGADEQGRDIGELATAGTCPLGKFDQPAEPQPVKVNVIKGVVGLAKAATGIDRAGDDTIASRKATCDACQKQGRTLGLETCGVCGCSLAAKRRIKSEACPLGKW